MSHSLPPLAFVLALQSLEVAGVAVYLREPVFMFPRDNGDHGDNGDQGDNGDDNSSSTTSTSTSTTSTPLVQPLLPPVQLPPPPVQPPPPPPHLHLHLSLARARAPQLLHRAR
ncbi:hypothetical protein DFJ58DRAFT_251756 [Suillus subalutaceus]|uniref:uncharacterized protein n=1 Tax=Suillus subalutaceus TaxID=48586 RepID=UPI001B874875|nr:uncharacterized protein DFJ58DRAFT_251756 [Suillus subalutaceus]KAG1861604.1 hypothetical protein DFJ58DRAFT_251756 [Suillus subalutaceus]